MEVLLNIIWLITVGIVATAVLKRSSRTESASLGCASLCLVLICIAALLFPAISITDDLQQVAVASEELGRYLLNAADYSKVQPSIAFISLALLLLGVISRVKFLANRAAFAASSPLAGFCPATISRPPPAVLA